VRPEKKWMEAEYTARMSRAGSMAITRYSGLSSDAINDLRRELGRMEAELLVVKNRIFRRALSGTPFEKLAGDLGEQTAVALAGDDVPAVIKTLLDFAEKAGAPSVRAVMWGGDYFDENGVKRLASLPGREELLGSVVRGIQSPLSGFAGVLHQLLSGVVIALRGVADKKSEATG